MWRLYDLPIWAGDLTRFPRAGFRGAGFRFFVDEVPYVRAGSKAWERHFLAMRKRYPRYSVQSISSGDEHWIAPQLSAEARSRVSAQRAFELLLASLAVLDGNTAFELNYNTVVPRNKRQLEDLEPADLLGLEYNAARPNVGFGCRLAAALSRKKAMSYAAFKLQLSYQLASTHWMNLHPRYHPKNFSVSGARVDHVRMASAITLAYSAIEELQLEPRAIKGRPIKTESGWDEAARQNLHKRLRASRVNISEPLGWTRRGSQTRVHKSRRAAAGVRQPWTKGIVRDRAVALEDALIEASWLRSKCTTHKYQEATSSISMYDVANVQLLARRLLLESCRLWKALLESTD